eukprot:gene452-659_t
MRASRALFQQVITLTGRRTLKLSEFEKLCVNERDVVVQLTNESRKRIEVARELVEHHVKEGNIVYGLTTGFGKLKSVAIETKDLEKLQENLVLSHSCGVGPPMPIEEVRIAQVLRLNGLVQGYSGIRLELVEVMVRLFNKGFVPWVPCKGSVGASGDLAPLSHMAAAYMGHGQAYLLQPDGSHTLMPARDALDAVGEKPVVLQAKEGLAMINGTEIMKSTALVALSRAKNVALAADAVAALSLEALMGTATPFDDRLAVLKQDPGHRATSHNVRTALEDSDVLLSHTGCDRVQDAYSLRCIPIVHGAVKSAIHHVSEVLAREINSVTDNPIIFPDTKEIISAGHFHGMCISMAMDYLALSLCTLANISERRTEQLVNPDLSHLPGFLASKPGLDSGYMIAQVASASLCSENKVLAHPASVDTIPTSANQEDHVSMGPHAARKARDIAENTEHVVAIELLCASQGRSFHSELSGGRGTRLLQNLVRSYIPPLDGDRYTYPDMQLAFQLVRSGAVARSM